MPRTSVGNISASIVPTASAAGAAATMAMVMNAQSTAPCPRKKTIVQMVPTSRLDDRDRSTTACLGDPPGEQDAEEPGKPGGDRAEAGDARRVEAAVVGQVPVRELGRRCAEDVGEEADRGEQPEPAAVPTVDDLADPAPVRGPGRELLVPAGLLEVPGEDRDQERA